MDLYREEILEHWRNPQNFGEMEKADRVINQINPLCGDQLTFFFKVNNGKVIEVSFTGNGCAISIASASMLSEFIKGKSLKSLAKIEGRDVFGLIGGPVAPARLKCALLAFEALRKLRVNSEK